MAVCFTTRAIRHLLLTRMKVVIVMPRLLVGEIYKYKNEKLDFMCVFILLS